MRWITKRSGNCRWIAIAVVGGVLAATDPAVAMPDGFEAATGATDPSGRTASTGPVPYVVGGEEVTPPTGGVESMVIPVISTAESSPSFCGGVVIGTVTVLTSASCVVGIDPSDLLVGSGDRTVSVSDRSGVGVSEVVLHPAWGAGSPWDGDVDLALLRLDYPVELVPIDLMGASVPPAGTTVHVYGWGATSSDPPDEATYPDSLMTAPMDVATPLDELVLDEDDVDLCGRNVAGSAQCLDSTDASLCYFDWGGPVLSDGPWSEVSDPRITDSDRPTLLGVVSWATTPCEPAADRGAGMVPIAPHVDWIAATMTGWGQIPEGCYGDERGDSPFTSVVAGMPLDGWTVPCWSGAGTGLLFTDVAPGRFYDEPVRWLTANEITTGCTATTFCPDRGLTRAEAITFIWRMVGTPPAVGDGFTDVTAPWQQSPVIWGRAHGITTGTSPTIFSPDRPVTRGEFVTFLHRLVGSLDWGDSAFGDLTAVWQVLPVGWAWAVEITAGCGPTTFCPDRPVTRGEAAAFLQRFASWS